MIDAESEVPQAPGKIRGHAASFRFLFDAMWWQHGFLAATISFPWVQEETPSTKSQTRSSWRAQVRGSMAAAWQLLFAGRRHPRAPAS